MPSFRIVCMNPAGTVDPAIGIAASRAGELGMLNVEFVNDVAAARDALASLARHAAGAVGIRFGVATDAFITATLNDLPAAVQHVVLGVGNGDGDELRAQVLSLRVRGCSIWVEVTDAAQASRALEAGADGLVAKGHESGGWVGEETTFVLLQRLLASFELPVWAFGGIGMHTAAAAIAGGADGIVLESQLGLMSESPLPPVARKALSTMDGSETVCVGDGAPHRVRVYSRPHLTAVAALSNALAANSLSGAGRATEAQSIVSAHVRWDRADAIWPLGQDACFARSLSARHPSVAELLPALRRAITTHIATAVELRPIDAGSPLAVSHGTHYPIVQGPMTRVSDTAAFALSVAEHGALPFVALALMRADEVDALLRDTQERLGEQSWGVGILGFVPAELRQEQLEVVRRYRPRFVLIAGGRPDQARSLEKEGMTSYLHVPSPGLLKLFLDDGARHFVFEGRECGGHVGPRSSFVLWNAMIDVLLAEVASADAARCHVLFAGGLHDARSAAMVAAMAAPLAARGIRIGVLVGTAYLFTSEAVDGGAIMPEFQKRALECRETVLLESGVGHAVRCIPNAFTDACVALKQKLVAEGLGAEEIRVQLDELNIGRLRVASKGVKRNPDHRPGAASQRLLDVDDAEQWHDGMYMIGQVASLRHELCSIGELHADIATGGTQWLESRRSDDTVAAPIPAQLPANIAIIGMSALLPKAPDLATFWSNVLNKVYAIGEVPPDRWDWHTYFDSDRAAKDKIYSKWGGFLEDSTFDPLEFGMPPNSLASIDPMQLLALNVAKAALADAGYLTREFNRQRTAVILGASGGSGELGTMYNLRSSLPLVFGESAAEVIAAAGTTLPEWTEDSFAGLLPNVASGRIANRFDLGGVNYVVDAACASSLAAVHQAVKELETGGADMVLVGGIDTVQTPFGYLCFSKTQALSPSGRPRTFDAEADGIAISEGLVMLVLKRVADAERDGDRIYAVIQGTAGSSDGKAKGLTAPRPEGQQLALERAYHKANIAPTSVGLFEAHGTGTVVGDRTEAVSLATFLEANGAMPARHAVGSVKSMIGHTKATAGVAGLAKVALALHHKVLPATLGVTAPNPKARFSDGPLYVNAETRPWIQPSGEPRRAGVSAFGFGGTNFHAVVEEYTHAFMPPKQLALPSSLELFVWSASTNDALVASIAALDAAIASGAEPALTDLAFTLAGEFESVAAEGRPTAAVIAGSLGELRTAIGHLRQAISSGVACDGVGGAFWTPAPQAREGNVAILFPGQGSQSPNMLRELAISFEDVRTAFERADRTLQSRFPQWLSDYVFPPPAFGAVVEQAQERALTQTNVAQPALGAADVGVWHLLRNLGVHATAFAGHSYGEFVALHAAGVFDEDTLFALSEGRGRSIIDTATSETGTMAAVTATAEQVSEVIAGRDDVWLANMNAPQQTVISGTRAGIDWAVDRLKAAGLMVVPLPVACAFHSPLVAPAKARLSEMLAHATFRAPSAAVFSNTTAKPYAHDPDAIRSQLAEHLVSAVRFTDQIHAMHASGIRVFIEAGPRNVLSTLVGRTLGDLPHVAIATDLPARPGVAQLLHALAQLVAHGCVIRPLHLFRERNAQLVNLHNLAIETKRVAPSASTWLVNGGVARPMNQPIRKAPVLSWPASGAITSDAARAPSLEARGNGTRGTGALHGGALPPAHETGVPTHAADSEQVMLQFQGLMSKFLDTQRHVMSAYLGQPAVTTPRTGPAIARSSEVVPSTATPPAPSIAAPAVAPVIAAEARPAASAAHITAQLLQVVSDRTGYPTDMLSLDADVEAELGIDSIKRVEIIGVLQRTFLAEKSALDVDVVEQLTTIKTLRGIVTWIVEALGTLSASDDPVISGAVLSSPQIGEHELQSRLLAIVSDRTGYPSDMLTLDADVEADLGIDSIKRIEILSAFQKAVFSDADQLGAEMMEQLASIKTLGGIVTWISDALAHAAPHAAPQRAISAPAAAVVPEPAAPRAVPQHVFEPVERPLDRRHRAALLKPGRCVLITDDTHGAALALRDALGARGVMAIIVGHGTSVRATDATDWVADVSSEAGTQELLGSLAAAGHRVGGLVHLSPLQRAPDDGQESLNTWRARVREDVKSLFYLLKLASPDLQGGFVAAVCNMGGTWGMAAGDDARSAAFPGHAAIAGMIKSVAQEWPSVHCKAIDVAAAATASDLALQVMQEITSVDPDVQVGYERGRRVVPVSRPIAAEPGTDRAPLNSDSVVLVTGGARGITAAVAAHLAKTFSSHMILVGRSTLPAGAEEASTASLTTATELKGALIARHRSAGRTVTVRDVERECQSILRDREIRANLSRIAAYAASVEYVQADVCDEQAIQGLVSRTMDRHGRIDALVHGAGVIEDKRIEDKSSDSFDRVFDTKADSAFLLRSLLPDTVRSVVLFSSAAGAYGNKGQADYSAANEVLNSLARQWGGHGAVAIGWGPWAGSGMVNPLLEQEFKRRGIELITPFSGCDVVEGALRGAVGRHAAIVVGSWDVPATGADATLTARETSTPHTTPLLTGVTIVQRANGIEAVRTFDPGRDLFLKDHCLDGVPVMPLAMATELMAEMALAGWPDLVVSGMRDCERLRGVVFSQGAQAVRISARALDVTMDDRSGVDVAVEISDPANPNVRSYRAIVEMATAVPVGRDVERVDPTTLSEFGMTVPEFYHRWLFHGPLFQNITEVRGVSRSHVVAHIRPSVPVDLIGVDGTWLIDPVALDCGLQLAVLWTRQHHDMTPLPARFGRYRRFASLNVPEIICEAVIRDDHDGHSTVLDLYFRDGDARLLAMLESLEVSGSASLNRIATAVASSGVGGV